MDITDELKPKLLFPEPVAAKDEPPKGELFELPEIVPVSDLAFTSVVSAVEVVAGAETSFGGIAEKPNLIGGSLETKEAAPEPKRLLAEAVELPVVATIVLEMLFKGATIFELLVETSLVELPNAKADVAEKAGLVANSPSLEVMDGAPNEKIPLVDTASNLPLLSTAFCELSNRKELGRPSVGLDTRLDRLLELTGFDSMTGVDGENRNGGTLSTSVSFDLLDAVASRIEFGGWIPALDRNMVFLTAVVPVSGVSISDFLPKTTGGVFTSSKAAGLLVDSAAHRGFWSAADVSSFPLPSAN